MLNPAADQLPLTHQVILACVQDHKGLFTRSELAKILVGSDSTRISDWSGLAEFGRLADKSRKTVTFEIDILLQQKYLALDRYNNVIPAELSFSALPSIPPG